MGAAPRDGHREAPRDGLEHPRPREVHAVEMPKLGVGGIGHDARREPAPRPSVGNEAGIHAASAELRLRQHAPHQVGLRHAGRQEVFAGRLVGERARAIVQVEIARAGQQQRLQFFSLVARAQSSINPNEKAVCECSPIRMGAVSFGSRSAIRETAALVKGWSVSAHS